VTGSTAFRVADVSAEVNYIGASSAKATYWGSSSLTGASQSVITGNGITFYNHFTGSIAGDEAIIDNITTTTFGTATGTISGVSEATSGPLVAATDSTPASGGNGFSTSGTNPAVTTTSAPDVVFSDVSFPVAKAIINSPNQTVYAHTSLTSYANSSIVGIIPFVFVANGSTDVYSELQTLSAANKLSIDPQKFTYTWQSGGSALLSFFTGQNSDEATTVYPLGRDVDSGTRATALAETGYTLNGSGLGDVNTPIAQFAPYDNSTDLNANTATGIIGNNTATGATIAGLAGYPAEGTTIDGYNLVLGNGGYNSGGNLAIGLSTEFVSGTINTAVVGYLGVSDAVSALTSGTANNRQPAVLLAYNGSRFDPTTTASAPLIQEGQYTYWNYETLFYSNNGSTAAIALKGLLNGGLDELASDGVNFNAMEVSRTADGEEITSNL
jgi:hypothetical protein